MKDSIIAGVDLAKKIMHICVLDSAGKVNKKFKVAREEFLHKISELESGTIVAMEACGSSNYWAQQISELGFKVKLIKTKDAKVYAKSKQKNDLNDALAVAKAARDPELKPVKAKTKEEQDIGLLHKTRQNTIRDRVQKTNAMMSALLEYGYMTKLSKGKFSKECNTEINQAYEDGFLNKQAYAILQFECQEITALCAKEKSLDKLIVESNKQSSTAMRLQEILGIGPINASCLSNSSMETYSTPRDFAASLGLVPKQNTSGDKIVLGRITKQGDRYKRTMLIQAGRSIVMRAHRCKNPQDKLLQWAQKKLAEGKHFNLVCVGVANKLARIAHAVVMKNSQYGEI